MATQARHIPVDAGIVGYGIGRSSFGAVSGLHAARSPLKVLNHHDLSVNHDMIARRLGVHHLYTDPHLFSANQNVLEVHHTAILRGGHERFQNWPIPIGSTRADLPIRYIEPAEAGEWATAKLCENAKRFGLCLGVEEVRSALRAYSTAAQVELHPSDICNENCRGCTYGHDDPTIKPPAICFPFHGLEAVARLQPRSIVLVGGGEPLLYKDPRTGKRFPDLVDRLRELLPACRFGLVSNGTVFPDGDWYRHFDWIRFSIDAADAETYARVRGRDLFGRVCENLGTLLRRTSTQQINVGYLFSRQNVGSAAKAALFFFDLVDRVCPEALSRVCIEYRPLRRDRKDERRDFPEAITEAEISEAEEDFHRLALSRPRFAAFLSAQTNWEIIRQGNTHAVVDFRHCAYSSIFRLIRANGEVRPCCMRLSEPEFYLGNILSDSPESIALNLLFNGHYLRPGCDGPGCKLGETNRLIEDGLAGRVGRSRVPAVASNPFFG